ncbi:CDP-diacylglycerol--serine O-phosphatidyltransferase [Bauldia litoralis]|uniref:CDP-diacylglycerol--serine O-phosphatidyltransferase n=1 Tax=Bauldia litoralis TaxID=665467 RepID=A0A1G6DEN8_9HYPH|nr:CDP-diacylglycerol--serine O-phosphatidyltransferase [Bauldia litoralis]SDB43637.1 CDP-diacylglycerol--serine O-phosphatidyltransferase [Bauldia litoralis]
MSLFQSFDPDDEPKWRRLRQLRAVPIRMVLPSVVTLLALCAGLTSIRMSIEARFDWAIAAVAIAAALDGIDGRVARFLKSTSRFGAELDSLTDFVNFGVAPAILLYVWALDDAGSVGWIAALIFAICSALRLARFNVSLGGPKKPEWQSNFFVGVPAPAGAMIVFLPVYLELLGAPHGVLTAPLVIVYTLAIALLFVSRVPTWSGKLVGRQIPRDMVLPLFVVVVLVVALLVSFPWETMSVLTLMYLGALPLSWRSFHRHMAKDAGHPPEANGDAIPEGGDDPESGPPPAQ